MHIGLIGGIGPAATEFYYRGLVRAHNAGNRNMELTIAHASVKELLGNLSENNVEKQVQIFLRLAQRLQLAGAEAIAITSIAGHFCIEVFQPLSPIPVMNAITALKAAIAHRNHRRVGLLGTRAVMASRLYGGLSDIEVVVPEGDHLNATHDAYVAMGSTGQVTEPQRATLFGIGKDLCKQQGAEVVVLAGTDLFLAFDGRDCGFPVMDSAQVHIDAIYRESIKNIAPA